MCLLNFVREPVFCNLLDVVMVRPNFLCQFVVYSDSQANFLRPIFVREPIFCKLLDVVMVRTNFLCRFVGCGDG